jgi:hypothetical protein
MEGSKMKRLLPVLVFLTACVSVPTWDTLHPVAVLNNSSLIINYEVLSGDEIVLAGGLWPGNSTLAQLPFGDYTVKYEYPQMGGYGGEMQTNIVPEDYSESDNVPSFVFNNPSIPGEEWEIDEQEEGMRL